MKWYKYCKEIITFIFLCCKWHAIRRQLNSAVPLGITKYVMKYVHDIFDHNPQKRILRPWNQWESLLLHLQFLIWNSHMSGASRHQNTWKLPLKARLHIASSQWMIFVIVEIYSFEQSCNRWAIAIRINNPLIQMALLYKIEIKHRKFHAGNQITCLIFKNKCDLYCESKLFAHLYTCKYASYGIYCSILYCHKIE